MNKNILLLSVVLAGAAALQACGTGQAAGDGAPPAPEVSVAVVQPRAVQQWDEFTGRVEAVDSVELRPRVSGYIEEVRYREGQEVRKGDVLFVIDPRAYRSALAQAEGELARARSQADLAQAEVARARRLVEARALSQEEHDRRAAALAQAQAGVRAAQATAEIARLNLEFTEVRSPIDGRAGQALVTAGNLVNTQPNATLLTTVVSLDPVHVYFQGDEQTYLRYTALARSGERPSSRDAANPVQVGLANETGFPHAGTVDFVDNQLDPATGTIRARAVVPNPDRVFTPGLFARVRLVGGGEHQAVLVDDKAVLTDQDRKYVYVLGADATAQRRDVRLGQLHDGLREITHGLAPGDRVIVHGVQKIFFPGMAVKPIDVAMGDGPRSASDPTQIARTAGTSRSAP